MIPRIAVVGHPNKGKSSIVATLAEDDGVGISHFPGTTTKARAFPLRVDTEVLYELIDTPGFQ
ncbi:MAG: 50S ribosome-binding GTPase, partial [Gammaproteobacteria bacterium]|nr:50S ribosome-binding GTPase [Gammaproteobacteria bacterium]